MKNIIIVGDSFCADKGWPNLLADKLNLKLIQKGSPGQSWWENRKFLEQLPDTELQNTEVIVFAHTNADRIPAKDLSINKVNHANLKTHNEIELAVKLYFKYIHEYDFLSWAVKKWYNEINEIWSRPKTIHLFSFRNPKEFENILNGLQVTSDLCSISLNELGVKQFRLFNDNRSNHLSKENNIELACQLHELIVNYTPGTVSLDTEKFQLKTDIWFKDETWNNL